MTYYIADKTHEIKLVSKQNLPVCQIKQAYSAEVKVENVIKQFSLEYIPMGYVVHEALDGNRQYVGLDHELGQNEEKDFEEKE